MSNKATINLIDLGDDIIVNVFAVSHNRVTAAFTSERYDGIDALLEGLSPAHVSELLEKLAGSELMHNPEGYDVASSPLIKKRPHVVVDGTLGIAKTHVESVLDQLYSD